MDTGATVNILAGKNGFLKNFDEVISCPVMIAVDLNPSAFFPYRSHSP